MRRCLLSTLTVLLLALILAACGGSSSDTSGTDSGSSTTEFTRVTNDAAGEFAAINGEIAKAAGGQADSAATWTGLADRLDELGARLKGTEAPTSESRAPLAALTEDVTKLGSDARAIAGAGGVQSAGAKLVDALTGDSEAVQADLQKLPLY